jgi:hypothetical protein
MENYMDHFITVWIIELKYLANKHTANTQQGTKFKMLLDAILLMIRDKIYSQTFQKQKIVNWCSNTSQVIW